MNTRGHVAATRRLVLAAAIAATWLTSIAPAARASTAFSEVAGGIQHSCGLAASGRVFCWGVNDNGELGDQGAPGGGTPVAVPGVSGATAIAAGGTQTCAIVKAGAVVCWGGTTVLASQTDFPANPETGLAVVRLGPALVPGVSGAIGLSVSAAQSCAVLEAGAVTCWGANRGAPDRVPGLADATAVAVGATHACALRPGGSVACWGSNRHGQLGNAGHAQSVPTVVEGLWGVTRLGAGVEHTCGLLAGGDIVCWGLNSSGELGDGPGPDRPRPVRVPGVVAATSLAVGGAHACAAVARGAVRCWGADDAGQLGDGALGSPRRAVTVAELSGVRALGAGVAHTCAVTRDAAVACWGSDSGGQSGGAPAWGSAVPVRVIGVTAASSLAVGAHSCAVVAGGAVRCWGYNDHGQLGDGTTATRNFAAPVLGVSGATAVAAGQSHTCVLLGGRVKCWGANQDGQLGNGTFKDSLTPVDVVGIDDAVAISTSPTGLPTGGHTCALRATGTVACWGANERAQLVNGTRDASPVPVPVAGLPALARIAVGPAGTCGVTAQGAGWCWPITVVRTTPQGAVADYVAQEVTEVTGLTSIASVTGFTCATTQAGVACFRFSVWQNESFSLASPVAGTQGAVAVAAGSNHACALISDGGVRCLLGGGDGQLGNGTRPRYEQPATTAVPVTGITTAVAVSAALDHTCALLKDGTIRCWGGGALGDGRGSYSMSPTDIDGSGGSVAGGPRPGEAAAIARRGLVRLSDRGVELVRLPVRARGACRGTARLTVRAGAATGRGTVRLASRGHSCTVSGGARLPRGVRRGARVTISVQGPQMVRLSLRARRF